MRRLILSATILAPAAASAGGYVVPNSNPRDLALSGASIADVDGPDAVTLNNAALAGPEGLGVSAGGQLLSNRTDWSEPSLGSASLENKINTPPFLSVSYGQKLAGGMAWGAGVGFNLPAGGSLHWPKGWAGQEFIQSVEQRVFGIVAGAGFQVMPGLKVGLSYIRLQATEELHQSVNYLDHMGDAGLAMSGGANSFGLGVEFHVPQLPLSLAATYSHSAKLRLDGHVHFEDVPPAFVPQAHDQTVSEDLTIPNIFNVAGSYEVMPRLKVMAGYTFERWTVYKDDTFVGGDGTFKVVVPRNYKNAHVLRLAGEWAKVPFLPKLTLRAGILRSISDQPTDTVSPSLTDASSWAPSIGAGFDVLPNLRVDAGYQHAFFDNVTADQMTASKGDILGGTYKTQVDLFSIGVNWRTDLAFLKK